MEDNINSAVESQQFSGALGTIYKITNKLNGKLYVGQTRQKLKRRIRQHINCKIKRGIDAAIAKYGWENFIVEVLEICPVELLNEREMYWIAKLNSKVPNGYNMTDGGEGGRGYSPSDETRAKISAKLKGRPAHNKGVSPSAESRAKISAKLKGRPAHNKGVSPSAETCAKISAAQKAIGNRPPDHTGEKRGPRSPETKAKLSAANKGKHHSKESLAKMSAPQRARRAREKKALEHDGES